LVFRPLIFALVGPIIDDEDRDKDRDKYAKFPRRCLSAGENIEFVGLGDLGVLAVGQIVKLQEKTMRV
jgi:hypothetical protein